VAVLNLLIDSPKDAVWDVLRDGWTYARWVAGTQTIREVDDAWPAVGSKVHFTAGIGPLKFDDVTYVRNLGDDRLELQAHAGSFGSARVSIRLMDWGEGKTLVIIDEHPLTGPPARFHNAFVELLLRLRNRRMAASLKGVVEGDPARTA
jgi:carbon monoxide dehydrogenase subunit G